MITLIGDSLFSQKVLQCLEFDFGIEAGFIDIRNIKSDLLNGLGVSTIVIVTERIWPRQYNKILEFSYTANKTAMFTTFMDTLQLFSPTFVSKVSPCHNCFRKREQALQEHPRQFSYDKIIREYFDENPNVKISGFLVSEARMAAAALSLRIKSPLNFIGQFKTSTRVNSRSGSWRIVALHGCRCRQSDDVVSSNNTRQTAHIAPILNKILS